ncbi:aspartate carbamoyltransferase [Feifania hominis]|uniref:aspartate carbamoyltransferase n=1 Tax=Feifania hominis TaxID=2763660 RepID=UPI0020161AB2
MESRHLCDFGDMPLSDWEQISRTAAQMIERPLDYADVCRGKVLGTTFFEPSTRTRFSFQAAMLRLGGSYIGFSDPYNSSVSKGENLKDTVRTVANYVDAIAMRHPLEGAAMAATLYSRVPVINAGDGGHMHPTQTLTDLLTIKQYRGSLEGNRVGFCGDLKNGRTVHSLIKALIRFPGNSFTLISTKELRLPAYTIEELEASGCRYTEVDRIEDCIGELDVLYMTRIQKERFASDEEYHEQSGKYILDRAKMALAPRDLIVMHPLPKIDEITDEVDEDSRCIYFKQAENGMYVRMALLYLLTQDGARYEPQPPRSNVDGLRCRNPRCITNHELYLPQRFKRPAENPANLLCEYCDHSATL